MNYKISILMLSLLQFTISFTHSSALNTNQHLTNQIDELVQTYADYGEFNGSILVANEGKVVYKKGLGLANMELDVANKTDTKFRIASVTKQFTAMLIVQLVAEYKLDLHTPISTYLPDYPKANGDRITIHHLLTHSSGTPNSYESPKPKVDKPDMIIPDNYKSVDLVNEFSSLKLEFTPGEKFDYSNSGYTLLGYIIETITGKKYHEVLQEKILAPLGMKNTGVDQHRKIIKNRAKGYFKSWGEYYNANYTDMSSVSSAGSIYSTVEDMFIWDRALYTDKLLNKKYRDSIFIKYIEDPSYGGYYGYGWTIINMQKGNSDNYVQTLMHDGVIDGFCAMFIRIPESQNSIILLSNIRRAPLTKMAKGILGILYNEPYSYPDQSLAYSTFAIINEMGIEEGVKHFELFKENDSFYISEQEINIVSYKLLQSNRANVARTILELGIEEFPTAFNLYDSLGEVLMNLGDNKAAIKNYKKSIELNPKNENGIMMLENLGVIVE